MENEIVQEIGKSLAAAKADHANSYLRIGAILKHVQDESLWKGHSDSFAAFVTEFGFSRSWAYQCIGVVNRFGERAKGVLPTRLQMLLPVECSKEDEDSLLTDARLLTSEAFRNVLVEKKGGKTTDSCAHQEIGSYCKSCGKHVS